MTKIASLGFKVLNLGRFIPIDLHLLLESSVVFIAYNVYRSYAFDTALFVHDLRN